MLNEYSALNLEYLVLYSCCCHAHGAKRGKDMQVKVEMAIWRGVFSMKINDNKVQYHLLFN